MMYIDIPSRISKYGNEHQQVHFKSIILLFGDSKFFGTP